MHSVEETMLNALRLNVKLERERYQPKGGMCATCIWVNANCSHMEFETMPVIGTTAEGQVIVRCTGHLRSNVKLTGRAKTPETKN